MSPVFGSVAIQASSSAAVVAAALLVASQLGLAAQGEFGLLRSWGDALATIAVMGLPQGLLHLAYREAVPVGALRRWVGRYVLVLLILCAMLSACIAVWGNRAGLPLPVATAAIVAMSVPFAAAHALWRSLLLRHVGPIQYAFITAMPAWLALIGLLPVCYLGAQGAIAWPLLWAAVGAATVSGSFVRRAALAQPAADPARVGWSRRTLYRVSIETGLQNVLVALSPALVLSGAAWAGASLAQIGAISLGLHVYQLFGIAAAYLAPMFYDRVARAETGLTNQQLWRRFSNHVSWSSALGMAAGSAAGLFAVRLLWPEDANSWTLLVLMALAGILSMVARLLITLMLARGVFRPLTLQAMARLTLFVGGTLALMQTWAATLAVPLALAFTEVLMLGWLLLLAHKTDPATGGHC
jgi:hypothetical protein